MASGHSLIRSRGCSSPSEGCSAGPGGRSDGRRIGVNRTHKSERTIAGPWWVFFDNLAGMAASGSKDAAVPEGPAERWESAGLPSFLLFTEEPLLDFLAGHSVAEGSQRLGQILARDVPRKPHTAISSSRTKWSRISFGLASSSSKWQSTASRTCS